MTTINELRQQIETKYLEPATERTPSAPLSVGIDASQTSFVITSDVFSPDEESLLGPGAVLELGTELVSVTAYDPNTSTVSPCRREIMGTTAAAHEAGIDVRFPTRWPRHIVNKSIRSAIEALWQPLEVPLQVDATIGTAQYIDLPLNTVRLNSVQWLDSNLEPHDVSARLLPVSPTNENAAAVQVGEVPYTGKLCVINYAVKVTPPTDDDSTIEYLPEKWERIIEADVAAELLSGVDIDAVTQENLTESLRLELFPVKSGASVSQNLIRYREYLIDQAHKEIKAKHPRGIRRLRVNIFG